MRTAETGGAVTRPASWSPAAPWGVRAWETDIDGPVHWVEFVGDAEITEPPIVFVHGLGGSHLNWVLVGPELASGRRSIAVDLPGFGLSPAAGRSCSIRDNVLLLGRFLEQTVGRPAVLVGNSMGCVVSVLAAASSPDAVHAIAMIDPALPIPTKRPDLRVAAGFMLLMTPLAAELGLRALLRWESPQRAAERVVRACFADPSRMRPEVLEASAELTQHRRSVPTAEQSFVRAARSLLRMLAGPATYRNALDSLEVPTLLIHGEADRLVPVAAARRVAASHPQWGTVFLRDVGHTPQLESPGEVIGALRGWLTDIT